MKTVQLDNAGQAGQASPAFRQNRESGSRGGNVAKISLIKMYVWEVQNEKTRQNTKNNLVGVYCLIVWLSLAYYIQKIQFNDKCFLYWPGFDTVNRDFSIPY